jgi:hypothetical protein
MKNQESRELNDRSPGPRSSTLGDWAQVSGESVLDWVDRINRRAYRRALQERFVTSNSELKRQLGK